MTVVVAYKSKKSAIMLSDSRASSSTVEDKLQKIVPLGKNGAVGFAGDVALAAKVTTTARDYASKSNSITLKQFQIIAKSEFKKRTKPTVFVMAVSPNMNGSVRLYRFDFPNFNPVEIKRDLVVVGSGDVIRKYLEQEKSKFTGKNLKEVADKLLVTTEKLLGEHVYDDSVGGMLQVILVDPDRITPLRYGFIDADPDTKPTAKGIEMKLGKWKQFDHSQKTEQELLKPEELVHQPIANFRFHDFKPPADISREKWHLLHFITCMEAKYEPGMMEFNGIGNIFSKKNFPLDFPLLACVGFWGSPGNHKIQFILENNGKTKLLYKKTINIVYLPQIIDLICPIKITVDSPGTAVLIIKIDDFVLGRKPFSFQKIIEGSIPKSGKMEKVFKAIQTQSLKNARQLQDQYMEKDGKSEIVYFSLCEKHVYGESYLKIENQFLSVYWKNYPLPYKFQIVSGFRLPKGKHYIELQLVNSATRKSSTVDTATIGSTSSFLTTPLFGESGMLIPEPGVYFINVLVDGKRITTFIFAAETEKARFSFELTPRDQKRVESGELLSLSRGISTT